MSSQIILEHYIFIKAGAGDELFQGNALARGHDVAISNIKFYDENAALTVVQLGVTLNNIQYALAGSGAQAQYTFSSNFTQALVPGESLPYVRCTGGGAGDLLHLFVFGTILD